MTEIRGYHAHVYYNADTRKIAEGLRDTIANRFGVEPRALSDEPRGPHPIPQFNVIFKVEEFQTIVPWLMLNHEGLDVLIHPLTESSYDDHSKNALWIGTPVPMRLEFCARPIALNSCRIQPLTRHNPAGRLCDRAKPPSRAAFAFLHAITVTKLRLPARTPPGPLLSLPTPSPI